MSPVDDQDDHATQARHLGREIARRAERKRRAQRQGGSGVWFGLGMFGVVGWSVAVPTLVGVAIGLWIDATWPSRYSWTLMLLVPGLALGCLNAWYWISRERRNIEADRREVDERNDE
jgi:ATP synthase protein I